MTKGKSTFRAAFLIYLLALALLALAALLYVRSVLQGYEDSQPERQVEDAIAELAADAESGALWGKYGLPDIQPGRFEEGMDVQGAYLALYDPQTLRYAQSASPHAAGELVYTVDSDGFVLARVTLRASGEPVTKLGILTLQPYELASIEPLLYPRDLTLSVPEGFSVAVNGVALSPEEGTLDSRKMTAYTIPGVYVKPRLSITDPSGRSAGYTFRGDSVLPELYSYTLTLPAALRVTVDGEERQGQPSDNSRLLRYDVTQLDRPDIRISDAYGNTVSYTGEEELPLTYMTISAVDCTVRLNGAALTPDEKGVSAEYANFADYVPGLPEISTYQIAVLQEDAEVSVTDSAGRAVELEPGRHVYDLTGPSGAQDSVPADIAAEVDVLDAAQKWSLFMSNDLRFDRLSPYLIKDSYQYSVAYKYAHSIDITFTSNHTLKDPAFTDILVTNFVPIADNCFSVDIRFVKHMRLGNGLDVDDAINDRFYFVKYDDTKDGRDNPSWKIAGMKEIVNDAG